MLSSFAASPSPTLAMVYIRFSSTVPFPRLCLVGAPGSGKGTVSKYLKEKFDLSTISTGDLLRDHISRGTELGKSVKSTMDQGGLVSDDIMIKLVEEEVQKHTKGWILDGMPRTQDQAIAIEKMLKSHSLQLNKVFFVDVDDKEIISRISGRLVHSASGRTYHVEYNPPKEENKDDVTGEPLTQRDDDKPETVMARLEAFHKQTLPVLDFFKKQSLLHSVKANSSDEAFAIIKPLVEQLKKE